MPSTEKDLLQIALQALEYHTAQTRPIYRTDTVMRLLRETIQNKTAVPCFINPVSSRICEMGTKSCVVHHSYDTGTLVEFAKMYMQFLRVGIVNSACPTPKQWHAIKTQALRVAQQLDEQLTLIERNNP